MAFSPMAANAATQAPAPVAYSLLVQEIKDNKVTSFSEGISLRGLPPVYLSLALFLPSPLSCLISKNRDAWPSVLLNTSGLRFFIFCCLVECSYQVGSSPSFSNSIVVHPGACRLSLRVLFTSIRWSNCSLATTKRASW